MESLGWRQRRGSSPAARRGARQRAGLTPVSASNTLSCERETPHPKPNPKTSLTVITVSTARVQLIECDHGTKRQPRRYESRVGVSSVGGENRMSPEQC